MNVHAWSLRSVLTSPVVAVTVAAVLLRLVLMPLLTYDFDIYHWALVISNIDSGNNLYNLDGYYYTPVWGYLLGLISTVQQFIVDIGPMAVRFTDLLPIEGLEWPYHIATITSVAFNVCMKIPLIACDVAVALLIYKLVTGFTGDRKKATYGVVLWLFCPIVLYMSSVQAMFDTFSALFLLLTVMMLLKDRCFFGGALFATAVLLKFFPAFCILVLFAYIVAKHRDDGMGVRKVAEALAGMAVMSFAIMLPLILNGQVGDSLSFIFDRASDQDILERASMIIMVIVAVSCALFFGHRMLRVSAEDADRSLVLYVMLTVAAAIMMSNAPQYVIVFIPLLVVSILTVDRAYLRCWAVIGVSAFLCALIINNYSLLTSLAGYTSLVSPDWLISSMRFLESGMGFNAMAVAVVVVNIFQFGGLVLLLAFGLAESIEKKFPKLGGAIMRLKYGRVWNED